MEAQTNLYCCDKLKEPSLRSWTALSASLVFGPWSKRNRSDYFCITSCCFPDLYEPNRLKTKFCILSLAPKFNMIITDIDICERQDKRMLEFFKVKKGIKTSTDDLHFISIILHRFVRPWWRRVMALENFPIDLAGKFPQSNKLFVPSKSSS